LSAVLFGSISTLADTSELQRDAFNRAFEASGLDWHWDRNVYLSMLQSSGGTQRIADYAAARGEIVDAEAMHAMKSKIFQQRLSSSKVTPRPGVVETVTAAKKAGMKTGLVTTTSRANIFALLDALGPDLQAADFDVVVDVDSVERPKPDGAAYSFALTQLGENAGHAVAIEDNLGGVDAAKAAGVACVAFPNQNTSGHDFAAADLQVDHLRLDDLQRLLTPA
jgi:HAD superfamily hydrolase (TIGR01509 family)